MHFPVTRKIDGGDGNERFEDTKGFWVKVSVWGWQVKVVAAQTVFEAGLMTYHRTDSLAIDAEYRKLNLQGLIRP